MRISECAVFNTPVDIPIELLPSFRFEGGCDDWSFAISGGICWLV